MDTHQIHITTSSSSASSDEEDHDHDHVHIDIVDTEGDQSSTFVNDIDFVASLAQKELEYAAMLADEARKQQNDSIQANLIDNNNMPINSAEMSELSSDSSESSESEGIVEAEDGDQEDEQLDLGDTADIDVTEAPVEPIKTKNELKSDFISESLFENLTVPDSDTLVAVGEILHHLSEDGDTAFIVQSNHTTSPLNEHSLLVLGSRHIIGLVREVFGPLKAPFYTVQYQMKYLLEFIHSEAGTKSSAVNKDSLNKVKLEESIQTMNELLGCYDESEDEGPLCTVEAEGTVNSVIVNTPKECENTKSTEPTAAKSLNANEFLKYFKGQIVYTTQSISSYITPTSLSKLKKGTDASNQFDEEVLPGFEEDFSDDETELAVKRLKKRKTNPSTSLPSGNLTKKVKGNRGKATTLVSSTPISFLQQQYIVQPQQVQLLQQQQLSQQLYYNAQQQPVYQQQQMTFWPQPAASTFPHYISPDGQYYYHPNTGWQKI